uniref:A2 mating type protein n=1 Tax=Heterobasidion abietinum TaxID=207833 RepID=S5RF76_9AGAM|nr:a2 mating type protein [Heterobasidion abietinum]
MSSICENDFLDEIPRVISILSQLRLRIASSREWSLPTADCDGSIDSSYSRTASKSLQQCLSLTPPQPLTPDLLALGLPLMMAQYISGTYIKAASRLKAKLEGRFQHRADRACVGINLLGGLPAPQSQIHVGTVYVSLFKRTVASWAELGMLSTRRWLLTASLMNRLRSCSLVQPADEGSYVTTLPHTDRRITEATLFDVSDKNEPLTPRISIGKKTKHSASLATRYSTVSSCDRTLDQMILESARLAPVTKPDSDAGLKSNQGAAITCPKPQRSAGQNPSPASWDLTSFIDDFDGLSIRDRSKSAGLKNEDTFGTCKAASLEHIFSLSKHSSSPINRIPIPAGIQSAASSSRLTSSPKRSCDIYSHSASSLSASKTIQSARRRKFAPCPNRDRSMQSTYRGSDVFFPRQTNDMTVTSSAANATELSDLTSHRLSPSASTHTRRRKIAPLPPRHPSTTTDIAVIISPDVRRSSQRPSHKLLGSRQSTTGTPGRLTGPLSRSPSLTSLSSDESGLSCSDELETPPSSPTLPSMILPTTSSTFSVSSDEYRFLSATFLHDISPAPQLLKAEIPRPCNFTFSTRHEDYPRFPFSR